MSAPGGPLVLAFDQGTSSSRALLVDRSGAVVAAASRELAASYPAPGDVRQDPDAIWSTQLDAAREALARAGIGPSEVGERVAAIGLTNQRETTVLWERATGRPIGPAIVWQSRVTAPDCEALRAAGLEPLVRERTGLPIDPYFSATKIRHLLRSEPGLLEPAAAGELCVGTVDSWLAWRLTGGRLHVTDVSNASRTMCFDLRRLDWDDELLAAFGIPRALLPEVRSSSEVYGATDPALFGAALPIAGIAGDQHAATFGQACLEPGMAKTTYGTGAFLMLNTGAVPVPSANGLLTTLGWQLGPGAAPTYALEGAVFVAGAAVQWFRDGLRAIRESAEIEALADTVDGTDGVYLVPAFTGLGAPWWDPYARGTIVGLTRGTGLPELARATVDSMAYSVADLVDAVRADAAAAGLELRELRVDGGAARNDRLLAFQAGLLEVPVLRPEIHETTALGAAFLAGLAVGIWSDPGEVAARWRLERRFEPDLEPDRRMALRRGWRRAVERSLGWAEPV